MPAKGNTALVPRTLLQRQRHTEDLEETTEAGSFFNFIFLHKFLAKKPKDPSGDSLLRVTMVVV